MIRALRFTTELRDGGDGLNASALARIAAWARERVRVAGGPVDVEITAGDPTRTSQQNGLWWALLGEAARRLNESGLRAESGRPVLKDDLHVWAKWTLLPLAVERTEAETQEPEEWEFAVYPPGSPCVITRTTTRLSKPAFSALVDAFLSDDLIAQLGIDGSPVREAAGKVRSGRIEEPDHLRLAPVPDALLPRRDRPARAGRQTVKGQATTEPPTWVDL